MDQMILDIIFSFNDFWIQFALQPHTGEQALQACGDSPRKEALKGCCWEKRTPRSTSTSARTGSRTLLHHLKKKKKKEVCV